MTHDPYGHQQPPGGYSPPPVQGYPPQQYAPQQQPYPQQHPYPMQPPPGGFGPPAPPKKNRALLVIGIIAAVVIGLCLFGAAMANFAGQSDKGTGGVGSGGKQATAGMNQPVRDGKFEFTVSKLECGRTSIGSGILGRNAQGEYCLVTVKVANIGKEAQSFSGTDQKLLDAKGVEYSNDAAAEMGLPGANTLFTEINPGNGVTGMLAFDVPPGTKPAAIVLHDSMFSGGVKVTLK